MAPTPDPARPLSPAPRSPAERLAAWLYTGPLGHLYGVTADVVEVSVRHLVGRARLGDARAWRRFQRSPGARAETERPG